MPSPLFGRYAAVGFEFTGSVLAGFFVGRAVDAHFGTHGVALWICFFLGISSGFWLLVRAARQLEKAAEADDEQERREAERAKLVRRLEQVERDIDEAESDASSDRGASKGPRSDG